MKNIGSARVTVEQFLCQVGIRKGILDAFEGKPFLYPKDPNTAVAYERGRHIGTFAKLQKCKIHQLYDGYSVRHGKPTSRLVDICRVMQRQRLWV